MAFQRLATVVTLLATICVLPGLSAQPSPAPAAAAFPAGATCPLVNGVPSNSCYNFKGDAQVCCINPDTCGALDAAGGATCQMGRYAVLSQTMAPTSTFTLIGKDAPCPVCKGMPSNACFTSYGDAKVCCVNPSSCGAMPATCTNNDVITFSGSFTIPTPTNC